MTSKQSSCLADNKQNILPALSQSLIVAACSATSALLSWLTARRETLVPCKVHLCSKYHRYELVVRCLYTTYQNTKITYLEKTTKTHNIINNKLQSQVLHSNCFTNSSFRLSRLPYHNDGVRTGCERKTECSVSSMLLTVLVLALSE
jgi:hypothetical protein